VHSFRALAREAAFGSGGLQLGAFLLVGVNVGVVEHERE
jgi:hypothetical protein